MKQFLFLIVMLAITFKSLSVLLVGPVPLERDSLGYWQLSTLVMQGDIFMMEAPIAYRTPLYPWFLATLRTAAEKDAIWLITLTQSLLYICTVWIAANLALKITKLPNAKLITACCLLPAVSAIQYTAAILSETLFIWLLLLHLTAVLHYTQNPSTGRAVWSATTFSLTVLTKPIAIMLWLAHLFLLIFYIARRRNIKALKQSNFYKVSHAAASIMVLACMISPWLIRNYLLFDKPVLTEFVGRNLWIVTFQGGSGSGLPYPETTASYELRRRVQQNQEEASPRPTWTVSNQLVASGLNDAQTDQIMRKVAFEAIADHRLDFAKKALRRCINFWRSPHTDLLAQGRNTTTFAPQNSWANPSKSIEWLLSHRVSQSVAGNTFLASMAVISLITLVRNKATTPGALWLGIIFAYFSIITGFLEIPDYRYRMIVEPLVGTTIGSGIAVLLSKRLLTAVAV